MAGTKKSKSSSSGSTTLAPKDGLSAKYILTPLLVCVIVFPFYRTWAIGDPWSYMYPNLLLWTGLLEEVEEAWFDRVSYEGKGIYEPTPVPEILAKDYSRKMLRRITKGFTHPAIVRGLFNNTEAVKTWGLPGVIEEKLGGDTYVPRVTSRHGQRQRVPVKLQDVMKDLRSDPNSNATMIFPNKSRKDKQSDIETDALMEKIRKLFISELQVDMIRPGFCSKFHLFLSKTQLVISRGRKSFGEFSSTGTNWHADIGANHFMMVHGAKRWYFLDPKYSAHMAPVFGTKHYVLSMMPNMTTHQRHFPVQFADLRAGDLLYLPDWWWHSIYNHEGVGIGAIVRESTVHLAFKTNVLYTLLVIQQEISDFFGINYRRYPHHRQRKG